MIGRCSSSTCRVKFIDDWLTAGLIISATFLAAPLGFLEYL
jgi:hypothetical protein